ncbi:MAG: amidohydrolase family protein [Candidatus Omnitrophica bacterium]|nr:amidohydrolase family protein [Candidatus Omnitrophota bacterium]
MIIDVNVNFGYWPFRRFQVYKINDIEKKLKENGIKKCFISHLGPVFNFQEVEEFNKELKNKIKNNKFFYFVPIVNPILADAEENLEKYKIIKLLPSFHNYRLSDKKFYQFFKKLSDKKIIIFLQMRYEDERSHNPVFKIKSPEIDDIKRFTFDFPEVNVIVLSCYFTEIVQLCKISNIYSDISFAENFKTIKSLLKEISEDKLVFGSHTPFLYVESGIAKLEYSDVKKDIIEKISYKNIIKIVGEELI